MSYIPLPNKSLTKHVYNIIRPVIMAPNIYNTSTIKKEDQHYVYFKGYKFSYDKYNLAFNQIQDKQSKLVINHFHTLSNNKLFEHISVVNASPNFTDSDLSKFSEAQHEDYIAKRNKYFAICYKCINNKLEYKLNSSYKSFDFIENEFLNELNELSINLE